VTPSGDLETFTLTALDLLGGAAEERTAGLYGALALGRGRTSRDSTARFDPELLDERPDAELVTFGSPVLEGCCGARPQPGRPRVSERRGEPPDGRRSALTRLSIPGQRLDRRGGRPWWLPAGIFVFRVRYLSDAREEDLVQIAVNLATGASSGASVGH
jgi:hypothetical protein